MGREPRALQSRHEGAGLHAGAQNQNEEEDGSNQVGEAEKPQIAGAQGGQKADERERGRKKEPRLTHGAYGRPAEVPPEKTDEDGEHEPAGQRGQKGGRWASFPLCEQDAENPERKRGDGEPGELIPDHERSSLRAGRLQMLKMAARDMRMKPA